MVRVVVTVLVGLQLLMPPGMCICRFTPAAATLSARGATPAAPPVCCTSCGSREHAADVCGTSDSAESGVREAPTPSPPSRDHLPGCPAVSPDVSAKLPVPSGSLLDVTAFADTRSTFDPVLASRPARRPARPAAPPSDPPLYISLCVLRI